MTILHDKLHLLESCDIQEIPTTDNELRDYLEILQLDCFDGLLTINKASFNKMFTRCSGRAWRNGKVEMNANFGCKFEFFATAAHELSHIYEWQFHGDSFHGKRFYKINQRAIDAIGATGVIFPSRQNNHKSVNVTLRKRDKIRFICTKDGCSHADGKHFYQIQKKWHQCIEEGSWTPTCNCCKSPLTKTILR